MMNSPLLARLALSVGAGLAAALLFIVPIKGTTIGFFLAYFAPLPIMIGFPTSKGNQPNSYFRSMTSFWTSRKTS